MMKNAGYEISIKKILEFQHKAIFKDYIEYLYSKRRNMLYKIKKHLSSLSKS